MEEGEVTEVNRKEVHRIRTKTVRDLAREIDENGVLVKAYAIGILDEGGDLNTYFGYDAQTHVLGVVAALRIHVDDAVREDWIGDDEGSDDEEDGDEDLL